MRRPATILVVDDHVALADAFGRALTLAGYQVSVAHSADLALREAEARPPSAIILDFQMPFINGAGFLYRLRSNPALQHTPVLIVTGQTLPDDVLLELRALDADVRVKPIGIAELVSLATSLVQGRRDPPAA
jgi:DNA-binding response OmpR family regulator